MKFTIKINPKPTIDKIDSNKVHVKNVSFMVKPKYSLNIQNPASFTCEQKMLPAPIAKTTNEMFTSDDCNNGKIIPTDEIAATVVEPNAVRNNAAASHARISGDISVPLNRFCCKVKKYS